MLADINNHITDAAEMLRRLAESGSPGMKWVCRKSTTGRGMRLHQVTGVEQQYTATVPAHHFCDTPLKALLAYYCTDVVFSLDAIDKVFGEDGSPERV